MFLNSSANSCRNQHSMNTLPGIGQDEFPLPLHTESNQLSNWHYVAAQQKTRWAIGPSGFDFPRIVAFCNRVDYCGRGSPPKRFQPNGIASGGLVGPAPLALSMFT